MAFSLADVRCHDLLCITGHKWLPQDVPSWVVESLETTPWVVVRRPLWHKQSIAVGARGPCRTHRWAGYLSADCVISHCSPAQLRYWPAPKAQPLAETAYKLWGVADTLGVSDCGPGGSLGFSWACALPETRVPRDLDWIVYLNDWPSAADARHWLRTWQAEMKSDQLLDVLLEGREGAIALTEYAQWDTKPTALALLRTIHGPRLISYPGPPNI